MIYYIGGEEFEIQIGGTLTNEGTKGGITGVFSQHDLHLLLDELKNTQEFGNRINTAEEYDKDQTTSFEVGYKEGVNDTTKKNAQAEKTAFEEGRKFGQGEPKEVTEATEAMCG